VGFEAPIIAALDAVYLLEHRGYPHYGAWEFHTVGDERVCLKCRRLDGRTYTGRMIARELPYHEHASRIEIRANVHPNCRCFLTPESR
jgi:hypothetical protein